MLLWSDYSLSKNILLVIIGGQESGSSVCGDSHTNALLGEPTAK